MNNPKSIAIVLGVGVTGLACVRLLAKEGIFVYGVSIFKDDEGRFSQRYPEGVDVLYFQCVGIVKKREVLLNLFELFAAILDRLVHIDSAYQSNPKIELK